MADNTTLNAGSGGDTYRSKDRTGVKTSIVALDLNPGGSESLMAGVMPVSDNSGSLTVDNAGTFAVQAAQSGTWAVTANAGTGTMAVSAASLPLPTGAATAAKQPALGTAGSASADVLTVQGIASMTAIKVDGSAVTQPVSGTFWQATQPVSGTVTANAGTGTFTVSGTVTANAGTGTFAVSAASLPLPSGASTSAKQPAIGTAGTASSDVLTVQGITSMVPLKVDGSGVTQPVSGTFWQSVQPVSGTFWQATQPVSGTVTANAGAGTFAISAIPAGTNLIGQTAASNETGTVYSGTTALTPKFAPISASSSGNTAVVAAVVGKKIRVLRWNVSSNGAVNVKFQRGTTDVTGLHYLTQFAGVGGGYCPVGHFETGTNEALNINLSASVAVGGTLTYVEV